MNFVLRLAMSFNIPTEFSETFVRRRKLGFDISLVLEKPYGVRVANSLVLYFKDLLRRCNVPYCPVKNFQ